MCRVPLLVTFDLELTVTNCHLVRGILILHHWCLKWSLIRAPPLTFDLELCTQLPCILQVHKFHLHMTHWQGPHEMAPISMVSSLYITAGYILHDCIIDWKSFPINIMSILLNWIFSYLYSVWPCSNLFQQDLKKCKYIVEIGGIQLLQQTYNKRFSIVIQRQIAKILGNLAVHQCCHKDIIRAGNYSYTYCIEVTS
jgi:hypothetical protein